MPVGPFAPESKTGVPKIAERGAPGCHPSLTKAPTARRSAPPRLHLPQNPGESRGNAELRLDPAIQFSPSAVIPAGAQRRAGISARWE